MPSSDADEQHPPWNHLYHSKERDICNELFGFANRRFLMWISWESRLGLQQCELIGFSFFWFCQHGQALEKPLGITCCSKKTSASLEGLCQANGRTCIYSQRSLAGLKMCQEVYGLKASSHFQVVSNRNIVESMAVKQASRCETPALGADL